MSNSNHPRNVGSTDCGWTRSLKSVRKETLNPLLALLSAITMSGCATAPLMPYTTETQPQVLLPVSQAGIRDARGRFREIFCGVLAKRGAALPDDRPCDEALVHVGAEPIGTGRPVDLGPSRLGLIAAVVPGVGWDCFTAWLDPKHSVAAHVREFGYDQITLEVDGLSSSARNARQIRDSIMQPAFEGKQPRLVLIGYSKGAPDILEALVSYPEIRRRVAAVVSVAGTIGGSPLANDAKQSQLALLQHWPGARCRQGDGGAVESLRPETRQSWLAEHALPPDTPYYSLVTFPRPERISSVLKPSYRKLSRVDARNDSQVLFYDQLIPGSALMGFLNADHWALAVPIARSHPILGSTLVNHNDFPREALLEAVLRMVEEDLEAAGK